MTPRNFDGAVYSAAVPQGQAVGVYPGGLRDLLGAELTPCPAGGLLAPSAGMVNGKFCYAGKGQQIGNAWLWNGERWIDLGVEAYGGAGAPCCFSGGFVYVSSVGPANVRVFDALTGVLAFAFTQEIGVEGIAAVVNGTAYPQKGWYGRYGFGFYQEHQTPSGRVRIGQGANGGLVAQLNDDPLKLIEAGDWQFITSSFEGDVLSVAASQFPLHRAVVRWLSVLDIRHAPEVIVNMPPPIDNIPPPIVNMPPPVPEPQPVSTPNRLALVQEVNRAFPHLLIANSKASCGEFTERVALRLQHDDANWGLVSKQPGEKQYRAHGIDSLKYKPTGQVIDIVVAAGAKDDGENRVGTPGWSEVPSRTGNEWMAPIPPLAGGQDDDPGDSDPPPPAVDLSELHAAIKALTFALGQQEERIARLETRPAPSYQLPRLRVKGNTSRVFAHWHVIDLEVVPE